MTPADLLTEMFSRIPGEVRDAVDGLTREQLGWRPGPQANSIAWLVWHLARIQDAQVADLAGTEQVWTSDGWYERFGLPFGPEVHGYGHTSVDVATVHADAEHLTGYLDAVHARSTGYLRTLGNADLDRIVDRSWDPPVTAGVRLVSIVDDCAQHAGQAAYLRGLLPGSAVPG